MKLIWNSAAHFVSLGRMIYCEVPVRGMGISTLRVPANSVEASAITKLLSGTESLETLPTQELFALKRLRLIIKPEELALEKPEWFKPLSPLSFVDRETVQEAIVFRACMLTQDRLNLFRFFSQSVLAGRTRRNVSLAAPKQYLTNLDFLSGWGAQAASAITLIRNRIMKDMGNDWVQSYPPKEPERVDMSQPSEVYLRRDHVLAICLHVDPNANAWPLFLGSNEIHLQPGDAVYFGPSKKNHRKPLPPNGLGNTLNFYFQESP